MKKKILSVLLAVVMLASACSMMIVPVSAATTSTLTIDENDGAYKIANADDVETFRTMIQNGETFKDKTVKLTANVKLDSNYKYTITQGSTKYGFEGTFNGNGFSIIGLNISGSNVGFFGYLTGTDSKTYNNTSASATIQNVAFINATVNSTNPNAGLLYGGVHAATITVENVYFDIAMSTTMPEDKKCFTGGLVGYAFGMKIDIKNCYIDIAANNTKAMNAAGIICGKFDLADGYTNYNALYVNNTLLVGDVNFKNSYISCGADAAIDVPGSVTLSGAVIDINHTTSVTDSNYPNAVGLWKATKDIYLESSVTDCNVSGLDATAVEGFTATVGHMVPTSLLKMFPQYCLETSTADIDDKIAFQGYQTTNLVDNKAKVRLVATLADDYKNYDEVGFEVVAVYEKDGAKTAKSQKVACTKVYSSISAVTGNNAYLESITAEELIGVEGYIFAMVITGVPAGITLQVRTYSVSGETTTYGSTEVFTIADIPGGTVGGN